MNQDTSRIPTAVVSTSLFESHVLSSAMSTASRETALAANWQRVILPVEDAAVAARVRSNTGKACDPRKRNISGFHAPTTVTELGNRLFCESPMHNNLSLAGPPHAWNLWNWKKCFVRLLTVHKT
jgi:hypothetical protein